MGVDCQHDWLVGQAPDRGDQLLAMALAGAGVNQDDTIVADQDALVANNAVIFGRRLCGLADDGVDAGRQLLRHRHPRAASGCQCTSCQAKRGCCREHAWQRWQDSCSNFTYSQDGGGHARCAGSGR